MANLHIGAQIAGAGTAGNVNRVALQPYGHGGGPWYINLADDASRSYVRFSYGSDPANAGFTLSHDARLFMRGQAMPRWDNSISAYVMESTHYYGHTSSETLWIGESNPVNIRGNTQISGNLKATNWVGAGCEWDVWCEGGGGYAIMYANGTIVNTGSTNSSSFLYNSDRSLKKDITPLPSSLEKIIKLQGYSFTWKSNDKKDIGVIAQEVEKIYPELVFTDEATGLKSVQYGNLVAPLIEAVKELSAKLDELFAKYVDQQKEIDELKSQVEILKTQMNQIQKNQ
jgi:hypothetical protein